MSSGKDRHLVINRHNAWLFLSPFLILYWIAIILVVPGHLVGDEPRYLEFAKNLLQGFYSPPAPQYNLWNGPGYPLIVAAFLFFKSPLLLIRLFNGLLLYLSLVLNYGTLSRYTNSRNAVLFTVLLGLYFPIFDSVPFIFTETLTWFLLSLIIYQYLALVNRSGISWRQMILTALAVAWLALTKVIFGYVILVMLLISLVFFLIPFFRPIAKKSSLVLAISLVLCLPWLTYTYGLTHKVFYWSDSGSMSLYTMSSPYPDELGDWEDEVTMKQSPNHRAFMDSLSHLGSLQRDEAYRAAAIQNIKAHPKKFLSNWVANIGRLFFSYPYSRTTQSISLFFTLIPNMFVIVFLALTLPWAIYRYRAFPAGFVFLFLMVAAYLFASSLVSSYRRMFSITMPFWSLYFGWVFSHIVSFKWLQKEQGRIS